MAQVTVLKREDVPQEARWNREELFETWDDWQAELDSLKETMAELGEFEGKLGESADTLADYLEMQDAYEARMIRLFSYVSAAGDVDANDKTAQGNRGQMMGVVGQLSALAAFSDPEIQAIGEDVLAWADTHERLEPFKQYLDNLLRQSKHTRSGEIEQILGMLQVPFGGTYQTANALVQADMKFPDAADSNGNNHTVAHSSITPTGIQSPDRTHRENAWKNYADTYLSMQNTLANNYLTSVKQQVFMAQVRGYDSVLHSRLEPNNMPIAVYDTLINTFQAHIGTWHKYWEVKAKAIGVDKIYPWDIWAPIVENDPVVTYEQAIDWIAEGMRPLGDEYVDAMRYGSLDGRWVDYAPNEGKMQGARSSWAVDSPPYIIMSYTDTLMSMSILAHELGHSMHGYLMDKHQPVVSYKGGISSSVAETASNFNQALTRAYLAEAKADDTQFQIAMIDEAMFNFHRYFFQMPLLAMFEYDVFSRAEQGQPLTSDTLNEIMREKFEMGYGDSIHGEYDRTQITWAQFMHLYAPFYTFQYSVGISAAHALADQVLEEGEPAAERYLDFLSAGSSLYTMDLFETAGVDMLSPEPVERAFKVLGDLVDRLDDLVS